ncbi:hypothetical protein PV327_007217 [Microctonus hyperodae]|uniref:Uncharacterized protein n=1 Tax=Microctonus hyperodae TaxID=165561 RepID=A0AA39F5Y0_MICHY|nr:hypothetical protein PV327_007217 [Microctonus hyperodae]
MSYKKKHLSNPNAHSNFIPTRNQESPDLLERCQTVFSDRELVNGSPSNLTDIIISDDDDSNDKKSSDSNVTIVLEPDIIIDYVRTITPSNQNDSAICKSPTKVQDETIKKDSFIRCKPLDKLLAKNNVSPSPVVNSVNSHIINRIDDGKVNSINKNTRKIFKNTQELIEKLNTEDSDSSSSVVPATPSPKCLKRRRIIVSPDSDSNTSSDNTLHNTSKSSTQLKSRFQANERRKLQSNSFRIMKAWSMHETTLPTSDSDSDDHNFERKKKQSPIKIKNTRSYRLNTRLAKSNARSKIKQALIKEKNVMADSSNDDDDDDDEDDDDDDDDDDGMTTNNRINQTDDSESSNDENPYQRRVIKYCWEWMSKYAYVEREISQNYAIPTGKTFYKWEQIGMIWWLIKSKNIPYAHARRTWCQMIDEGYLKHRTMRSLSNHFTRKIWPNLHKFSLPQEVIEKFNKIKPNKKR